MKDNKIAKKDNKSIDDKSDKDESKLVTYVNYYFNFFQEPASSKAAYWWSICISTLAIINVCLMILETCDGPNHYTGRTNNAKFKLFLSENGYKISNMICLFPILFDSIGRCILISIIYLNKKYRSIKLLKIQIQADSGAKILFMIDILCVVPFVFSFASNKSSESSRVIFRVFELATLGRVFRAAKDIPSFLATRIALVNSIPHLLLPLFFFFVFNMTVSVMVYLMEPCYNVDNCPWRDLFETSFFAVVTMTTTGYGNQIPKYEYARFLAIFIMLFGTLFLSMPLAIIGNEYEVAWLEVSARQARQKKMIASGKQRLLYKMLSRTSIQVSPVKNSKSEDNFPTLDDNSSNISEIVDSISDEQSKKLLALADGAAELVGNVRQGEGDEEDIQARLHNLLAQENNRKLLDAKRRAAAKVGPIMLSFNALANGLDIAILEINNCKTMSPLLLINLFEVKNWLTSLVFHLDHSLKLTGPISESIDIESSTLSVEYNSNHIVDMPNKFSGDVSLFQINEQEEEEEEENDLINEKVNNKKEKMKIEIIQSSVDNNSNTQIPNSQKKFEILPKNVEENENKIVDNSKDIKKKSKLWLILNDPTSSKSARYYQYIIIFLICSSVMLLYTESLTSYTPYGENKPICGKVMLNYCEDKNNKEIDPACYVQSWDTSSQSYFSTETKLKYSCTDNDCFGYGNNFGSGKYNTNLTCNGEIQPFQDSDQLELEYGLPNVFTSRAKMHKINNVCLRIECVENNLSFDRGNYLWIRGEYLTNFAFFLELLARFISSDSVVEFFSHYLHYIDILAMVPFFVELFKSKEEYSFSILSSSPDPLIFVLLRSLKILRLFKLTSHFKATEILIKTAQRAWTQILAGTALLTGLVIVFSILLYEVEKGKSCYVGDDGCDLPDGIFKTGQLIWVNKVGNLSQFPNIFVSLWFTFVTVTTTGYGLIVPVTNLGKLMDVFVMLAGACYMSMPLTAAASTFYAIFEEYHEKKAAIKKSKVVEEVLFEQEDLFIEKKKVNNLWYLLKMLNLIDEKLDKYISKFDEPNEIIYNTSKEENQIQSNLLQEYANIIVSLNLLLNVTIEDDLLELSLIEMKVGIQMQALMQYKKQKDKQENIYEEKN